jgi:light-regulated signal transduction histidine kinase (bacteriophytochrome)
VENAIKFRGKSAPHVRITADRREGGWCFSVADNGVGIDPERQHQIFEIFQRLHSREDYPGNGIGLALVRKIVEHHQGRIWVDSTPGQGSTFFFTIGDVTQRDPREG